MQMNFMIFACLQFAVWTFSAIDNEFFLSLDTVVFIIKDGGTSLLKQTLSRWVRQEGVNLLPENQQFFQFCSWLSENICHN